ncbi:MAG: hypothetical protein ACOCUL_03215 [Bacteroidota bacterium]
MKNTRFCLTFLIILLFTLNIRAQEVLMNEEVKDEKERLQEGPNLEKFWHPYISFGLITDFDESAGARINLGRSWYFQLGYRQKYKISEYFSLGYDLSYSYKTYNLTQENEKIFPTDSLYNKEKINFNNFGLELYTRFNFSKRGDQLGTYLDIGPYINWAFNVKNVIKQNDFPIDNLANQKIITYKRLQYTRNYNYGLRGRLGFRKYIIFGEYRLSNIIQQDFQYPELPRLTLGLQFAIY